MSEAVCVSFFDKNFNFCFFLRKRKGNSSMTQYAI